MGRKREIVKEQKILTTLHNVTKSYVSIDYEISHILYSNNNKKTKTFIYVYIANHIFSNTSRFSKKFTTLLKLHRYLCKEVPNYKNVYYGGR